MRRRGKRRSSRRRKSSSYNDKQQSSSSAFKDGTKRDGQGDQNVLPGSESERMRTGEEEEEEEEEEGPVNVPPHPNLVYTRTTKDRERGVTITTSVSVGDMKDSAPKITFQLSHQFLAERRSSSSASLSGMIKTEGFGLKLELQMEERAEPSGSAVESRFRFTYGDACQEAPPGARERPSEHAWTSREASKSAQTQEDACLPTSKRKDRVGVSRLDGLALAALHHTRLHAASADQAGEGFPAARQRPDGNVSCPKRPSWSQNLNRGCLFPMKRCHTFPGMSEALGAVQEELLRPYQGCVFSLIMNSLPFTAVRLQSLHQEKIRRASFGSRRPQHPPSTWSSTSEGPELHRDTRICDLKPQADVKPDQDGRQGNCGEEAVSWFHRELREEDPGPEEPPEKLGEHQDGASVLPEPVAAQHPPTLPQAASAPPDTEAREGEQRRGADRRSSGSSAVSADKQEEKLAQADEASHQSSSRRSADPSQHLRPVDGGGVSDHWAVKRKLFKENKQWSSAGGSSITSDMTDEQACEDCPSVDVTPQDEDRGFYAETFYSSAWVYQGDDSSGDPPPSLSSRTRAVSIRERTVKISKGTGEYPWGFRIQFSKPIVVTEVDTNGAAEEAGLMVGDYLLAVNGTDVTSIPHSEAANLARQGPDLLTLTIGSDIARYPSSPRPACRGYLYKRTQSGLIKGWRKRWFVLTHDCCLCYYRHRRDEGKQRPLLAVRLEGAEVRADASLGKPFVFRCCPQAVSRVFFFCANSRQEMKRWLEAMEKAIRPVTQNHVWEDVTRHNCSLPPLAVKHPERLGLLHKLDTSRDAWVQHYCILKDGCLSFYSGIRATHAQGGIYLQGYTVREQPCGSKKSSIELKPPSDEFKTFYFCAENAAENKRWILALRASVKKWLPLRQALQDFMSQPPEETRM